MVPNRLELNDSSSNFNSIAAFEETTNICSLSNGQLSTVSQHIPQSILVNAIQSISPHIHEFHSFSSNARTPGALLRTTLARIRSSRNVIGRAHNPNDPSPHFHSSPLPRPRVAPAPLVVPSHNSNIFFNNQQVSITPANNLLINNNENGTYQRIPSVPSVSRSASNAQLSTVCQHIPQSIPVNAIQSISTQIHEIHNLSSYARAPELCLHVLDLHIIL